MRSMFAGMILATLAAMPAIAMGKDDLTCAGFNAAEQGGNPDSAEPYMMVIGESAGATAMAMTTDDVGNAFVKVVALLGTSTQGVCQSNPGESFDDAVKAALGPIVSDLVSN